MSTRYELSAAGATARGLRVRRVDAADVRRVHVFVDANGDTGLVVRHNLWRFVHIPSSALRDPELLAGARALLDAIRGAATIDAPVEELIADAHASSPRHSPTPPDRSAGHGRPAVAHWAPMSSPGESHEARPGTQAVERAIAIMHCFREDAKPLGVSEIARSVGLNISTAHRLMRALVTAGFLEQDPVTERYRLGIEIAVLGQRALEQAGYHLAKPVLSRLADATGESVSLGCAATRKWWSWNGCRRRSRCGSITHRAPNCTCTRRAWAR